jgi:uncharacterized protein (TIGR02186 family)
LRPAALTFLVCGFLAAFGASFAAAKEEVVSDTSTDEIDIKLTYHGQDVLVFGTIPPRSRIVVKVSASPKPASLVRKGKVGPFWMTVEKVTIANLPAALLIYPQVPLDELFPHGLPHELEYRSLARQAEVSHAGEQAEEFAEGYIRLKAKEGLYGIREGLVETKKGKVFKLNVPISSKIPPGDLSIEILAVRGGRIVARDRDVVRIEKVGIERWLTELAFGHPALYGVLAVGLALAAGFGVGFLFREEGGGD